MRSDERLNLPVTWWRGKSFVIFSSMIKERALWIWHLLTHSAPKIRNRDRSIAVNGQTVRVQEKAWQVFQLLQSQAHRVISREELIDSVWLGNRYTGEKGLNQAIWQLRAALRDEARSPRYIRTIPRQGYQWISGQQLQEHDRIISPSTRLGRRLVYLALPVVALSLAISSIEIRYGETAEVDESPEAKEELIAEAAYLRGDQILVDYASGCRGIIQPSGSKIFGPPVISDNGHFVAFTVTENESCKTVTLNVQDRTHESFDFCPVSST